MKFRAIMFIIVLSLAALVATGCDPHTGPDGRKVPTAECEPVLRADYVNYDEDGGRSLSDGENICEFTHKGKTCWMSDFDGGLACWETKNEDDETTVASDEEETESE